MQKFPFVGLPFSKNKLKKVMKIKVPIWKIQFYGFVGNVNADLGLPWFSYRASFGSSRAHFRFKKTHFFKKNDFFDCVINRPIWPILMKKC